MALLEYWLDMDDRIARIGEGWDAFAEANGGADARGDSVIGHRIWHFLDGEDLRTYLNALFFAVRQWGHPIALPCRCDSPDRERHFTMRIRREPTGLLHVAHRQDLEVVAARGADAGATPPGRARCVICSEPSGTLPVSHRPGQAIDVVCRDCRRHASDAIEAVRGLHHTGAELHAAARTQSGGRAGLTRP